MKIGLKLILGFSLVILSLVVVGYFSITTSQKELQKSIGEGSVSLAVNILDKIDRDIHNRIEDSQQYSRRLMVQQAVLKSNQEFEKLDNIQDFISKKDQEWTSAPKEEITPFMQELINNQLSNELRKKINFYEEKYGYRVYGEIFITNRYGANIAQTGKTSDYNQGDEEWWQKAKQDGLYMSDVEYDESSDVYSVAIGVRIDDENGSFLGVMKTVLNIEEAFNIIKEALTTSKYRSVGIKLLDKNGRIIYDSEGHFKIFEDASGEEFFTGMTGDEGYFIKEAERGEEEEMFAYSHSNGCMDFKGLGWILVVEYEAEEIYAPINKLGNTLIIASLGGILLAVLFGFYIYHSLSRPITKLRDAAKEIGKGRLERKIEIRSKDEIGELASAFSQMTKDLRESRIKLEKYSKGLEKQVDERTKELEKSKKEMETKVNELEKFGKLSVGRELKMVELKKRVGELEAELKRKQA